MSQEETFRDFFGGYALAALGPAPEALAGFYDTSFLAAGPKGGAAFKNDEAFRAWLGEVHDFNARTGMTSLAVGSVEEAPVSATYTLSTVEWVATFQRLKDAPIRFAISYLLRRSEDGWKIAAYISHDDQDEVMRAHGLL